MNVIGDNTWLSDLYVGYKVYEYHKSTGLTLTSIVSSITKNIIEVMRSDGTIVKYGTKDCRIIYEYGTKIPDFYLVQYQYTTDGTPYDPTKLSDMTEVSSIDYDQDRTDKYVNISTDVDNE